MFELHLCVERRRRFLQAARDVSIEAKFFKRSSAKEVGCDFPFFGTLLKSLIEIIPFRDTGERGAGEVVNFRGRPPETFPLSLGEKRHFHLTNDIAKEELCFVSGVIFHLPTSLSDWPKANSSGNKGEREQPRDCENLPTLPFEFKLSTKFARFEGDRHIVYELVQESSGALKQLMPELSLQLLPQIIPMRIETFRFGFELFRSKRRISSLFSNAPVAEQHFFLTANSLEQLDILITEEDLETGRSMPMEDISMIKHLSLALEHANIFEGFDASIRSLLAQSNSSRLISKNN